MKDRVLEGRLAIAIFMTFTAGHAAALVRYYVNGLISFKRTIEQTTETMPLAPKLQQLLY